jgi:hypothetical protein
MRLFDCHFCNKTRLRTHQSAGPQTTLYLVSIPAAKACYPKIGMTHVASCWVLPRLQQPGKIPSPYPNEMAAALRALEFPENRLAAAFRCPEMSPAGRRTKHGLGVD